MKVNQRVINKKQYVKEYFPMGAWALIEKDKLSDKTKGGIHIPQTAISKSVKRISTGTILQLSSFREFETDWDRYIHSVLKVGMTVGFSTDVPHFSPMPPNCEIEGQVEGDTGLITMHISDILCVLCDTIEKGARFLSCINGAAKPNK